jgi:transcription elongation factor Elf1
MEEIDDKPVIEAMECPRCGSSEFAIEAHVYQASQEQWVVCRQCDWTIGELPKFNVGVVNG